MQKRRFEKLTAFLAIAVAGFATNLSAITYLKADAPAGGNGSSWATAYRNVEEAFDAAKSADNIIYAAAVIYMVSNQMEVTDGFKIYGGFAGEAAEETLEDRDPEVHQTILTADLELDDHWEHVVPLQGALGCVSTNLENETVLSNGCIHLPPPYMGDYDSYRPVHKGEAKYPKCAFYVNGVVHATIDGLCFTGFRENANDGNVINIIGNKGRVRVRNCLFIGNHPYCGQILADNGNLEVVACRFLFSDTSGASAIRVNGGLTFVTVTDCEFESCTREAGPSGGVVQLGGGSNVFSRCRFNRCSAWRGGTEDAWGGAGTIFSGAPTYHLAFSDCSFSYCLGRSGHGIGAPLFAVEDVAFKNCSFLNNVYEVIAAAGHTYTMFGNATTSGYKQSFEGCVFRDNAVRSLGVSSAEGDYCLGLIGNNTLGSSVAVVNCTFDSNRAEHAPSENVNTFCSRALVSSGCSLSTLTEIGVANCTFSGPYVQDVYDIVQYGTAHRHPLNVVNSIFMADDAISADSFSLSQPEYFVLRDCTVKNLRTLPQECSESGLRKDLIPFAYEQTENWINVPVLVPSAKTPGLRETADVAVNDSDVCTTYRFRLRGEETWQPLLPLAGTVSAEEPVPLADGRGEPRAFGTYTRGAIQSLTPTAETGANLLLRCEPYYGGTLSSPSTQSVVPGQPIQSVTATAVGNGQFFGWFYPGPGGALYSEDDTLTIPALTEDLALVAKFGTPLASITFDLGEAGIFEDSGTHSITIGVEVGNAFPPIPRYTESPDWHICGWDLFPATVPKDGGAYHAQYVSSKVQVVRVVPEDEVPDGSDGSGDSWANATSDLTAAYQKAGVYRGEIWMKEGVYPRTAEMLGLPNVSIIGGFAGTEDSADQADPVAHPTIITGDVNGDDYWMPEDKNPPEEDRIPIWNGCVFASPNPGGADNYWAPSGNNSDNTLVFLTTGQATLTNAVLKGLTFTGFGDTVLNLVSGATDLEARNCRFLANGVRMQFWDHMVIFVKEGQFRAVDCDFIGNTRICEIKSSGEGMRSSFMDCRFLGNFTRRGGACVCGNSGSDVVVSRCVFRRNCGRENSLGTAAAIKFNSARHSLVENCLFQENRVVDDSVATIIYTGNCDDGKSSSIIGCRFTGNRVEMNGGGSWNEAACIDNGSGGGPVVVQNCYFDHNQVQVDASATDQDRCVCAVGTSSGWNGTIYVNCSMVANEVENDSTVFAKAGIIGAVLKAVVINCLFDESRFTGPGAGAEFVWNHDHPIRTFSMVNTIARNDSPEYRPFYIKSPDQTVNFANCAISGVDTNAFAVDPYGYCYDVVPNPGPVGRTKRGPGGLLARGISGSSPFARKALPVWQVDNRKFYTYNESLAQQGKNAWRNLNNKESAPSSSVPGITLETPPIPDAFGAPRVLGKIAYGPLNVSLSGMFLMLR